MKLNKEQNNIVMNKIMGYSLIKGVAGSGKTTVAINRALFLLRNYCYDKNDKVIFITFNKSLVSYIKYIYNKIEKEERQLQFSLFENNKTSKVEIVNIDRFISKYANKYKKQNKYKGYIAGDNKKMIILRRCILQISQQFKDIKLISNTNLEFLLKEIEWIKACNYISEEIYQNVDRIGRSNTVINGEPSKILKNSRTREAIYKLLVLYRKEMYNSNLCDFNDNALMALKYIKDNNVDKYVHIVVDETQDLSKLQLDFITSIYKAEVSYSSILFAMDSNQSIYNSAWLTRGRSFTSIGFDMTGKSNILSKNYRTTVEIAKAAYSLIKSKNIENEDDNFLDINNIERVGQKPVLKGFNTLDDEMGYIYDLIMQKLIDKYDLKDIAIVSRKKNILNQIQDFLYNNSIKNHMFNTQEELDFKENSIKLITMHSIKGLEFKVIIIVGISEKNNFKNYNSGENKSDLEDIEKKLLYVSMTRANEKLFMSYYGKPASFLKDIDSEYLEKNDKKNIF